MKLFRAVKSLVTRDKEKENPVARPDSPPVAIGANLPTNQTESQLVPEEKKAPEPDPARAEQRAIACYKGMALMLAYLYLIYQVVLVVCLTVYYYYILGVYLPLAFAITVIICYLRSLTAFIALKLAHINTRENAAKKWKDLRGWFYWTIALMILAFVIIMAIIPLRISQLVNVDLQNLLIINGVDFVLFLAMGIVAISFCNRLLKDWVDESESSSEDSYYY